MIPSNPDENVEAMQQRVRRSKAWAWVLLLFSPLLMLGSCFLMVGLTGVIGNGNLEMGIGAAGVVVGAVCAGASLLLFHTARRNREILELMEATERERSLPAFQRQNYYLARLVCHAPCDGCAELSGAGYYELCDPFEIVSTKIVCQHCQRPIQLDNTHWQDSGESLADYRQRLRHSASWYVWAWRLALLPLLGCGVGLGLYLWTVSDREVQVKDALVAGGFGLFWIMVFSKITTKIGWRQKRWAQP